MSDTTKHSIGVIGGGSWATAIVKILSTNEEKINWWVRNEDNVSFIKKHGNNPSYLSSVSLDVNKIVVDSNLHHVLSKSDIVILAIPSAFTDGMMNQYNVTDLSNKIVFSAIKGIIPEHNLIVGDYLHKIKKVPIENIGVITGPCHAEEVAMEKLSYLTIASQNQKNATYVAEKMTTRFIKNTVSDDIYGTEYSGVLKNIFAIASGICHGLGYGDNFQAVLISNAIQEIKRFVDAVHPITRDINSSAYLGDLLVTAYSQFSRNRTFGNMIGKGYSVKSAQMEMNMIAEGYYAVKCIKEINKHYQVHMPITDAVYNIVYEKISPSIEIKLLTDKLS
ncbi:MAG: NAD(P)H-dependent glycerol-3-phosphate dehydrogenase [Bacteroidetes bacterium]|nr:NAD(P)H-dependent glycerol-3-phosphate dehydrogenase [Bacteroidota bacterium]